MYCVNLWCAHPPLVPICWPPFPDHSLTSHTTLMTSILSMHTYWYLLLKWKPMWLKHISLCKRVDVTFDWPARCGLLSGSIKIEHLGDTTWWYKQHRWLSCHDVPSSNFAYSESFIRVTNKLKYTCVIYN